MLKITEVYINSKTLADVFLISVYLEVEKYISKAWFVFCDHIQSAALFKSLL